MTMRRRRTVAVLLAAFVVVAVLGPATGAAAERPANPDSFALQQVDADDVLLRIDLQSDGDATWTVEYRVRLETDNETAAFRSLRDDVRSNPENFTSRFGDRMRATARAAENATGRKMGIRNVSVSARIQEVPQYGIVTYTFEWTNFATVEDGTLRAGDALSGLFLDEKTRLQIRWPAEYELASVTPEPTKTGARSVSWSGPADFGSDEPRVVVRKPGPLAGLWPLVAGVAVLVLLAAGGLATWRYRDRLPMGGPGPAAEAEAETTGEAEGTEEPPEELLSNEERVLRFVEEQGGRVKQQEIVEEMGWTEAKTSQVVSELREEGELEGFRLGRENVLRLPEEGEPGEEV